MKKITYLGAALLAVLSARAQYQHSFEGSTDMPVGFTVINGGDNNTWRIYNAGTNAKDGTNVARISYDTDLAHNDYLVFPAITVTPGVNDRIGFSVRSTSATYLEPYQVVLSTTGTNEADFNVVLQPTENAPNIWDTNRFDLSAYAGQTVYVAIRALGLDQLNLDVDQIISDANPGCTFEVDGQTVVVTPTATTATISFPAIQGVDSYIIHLTTAEGVVEYTTADATYVITDLTPSSSYSIAVQTVCDEGVGELSTSVSFVTPCLAYTVLGTVEGNEGTTGTALDNCWKNQVISGGSTGWVGSNQMTGEIDFNSGEGTRIFRKGYSSTTLANLISPAYDLATVGADAYKVSMKLYLNPYSATANKYMIYANTQPNGTGAVLLGEVNQKADTGVAEGWYDFDFEVHEDFVSSSNVYFIIHSNGNSYDMAMDAFLVSVDNGCFKPSALTVSNITANGATANWEVEGETTTFEYIIATTNATPTQSGVEVTGTSVELTNLDANTNYFVYVRSVCGEGVYSDWSNVASFTTACESITALNVLQSNEGTTNSAMDSCWKNEQVAGTAVWAGANGGANELTAGNAPDGTRVFRRAYNSSSTSNLISPAYNLQAIDVDAFKVGMYLYQRKTTGTATATYAISVNTSATGTGAQLMGTVNVVDSSIATDGWYYHEFQVPAAFANEPTVYFVITSNGSNYDTGMDAFVVSEDNGCYKPVISVDNISTNTADIAVTVEGDSTTFEYFVATANEAPTGAGTEVTGLTFEIGDLDPSTSYWVFVRTVCGEGVYSDWSTAVTFNTECVAYTVIDVVEGNETTTGTAIANCWTTQQVGGTVNWIGGLPDGELTGPAPEGTRVFKKLWNSSSVANLISPAYNLSAIGLEAYKVEMSLYRRNSVSSSTPNASYKIFVNTTASTEGAELLEEVMFADTALTANGWTAHSFNVPAEFATAENVYFIIQSNGSYYATAMDAFVVTEGESLGTGDFGTSTFVAYPNPVKDVLNLNGQQMIDRVQVYNALGQEVYSTAVNATDVQLNMAHLPQGTYFVKVAAQGATRTVKVVKN